MQIKSCEVNLTYDLPIPEEVAAWMKALAYDDGIEPKWLDIDLTKKDFQSVIHTCNQDVYASPSGFGYIIGKLVASATLP